MSYTFRAIVGDEHFELPDFQSASLGFDFSEIGILSAEYAKYGVNANRLVDKAIIVALWNGEEDFNCRYMIRAGEGDDSTESFTKKFTGFSLLNIFSRVVVEEIAEAPGADIRFDAATAGGILNNLLTAAQARGSATGITWDFDDLVDSNGDPWDKVISLTYRIGLKYLDLIRNLVDQGMVEVRFNGDVLQAFNADAMGLDLSEAVTLKSGQDYEETPRKWSSEEQARRSLTAGDDGIIVRTEDVSVPIGPFGIEEMAVSQGGTKDLGTLALVNTAALDRVKETRQQLTRKVVLREDGPIPNVDYSVSDYISESIPSFDGEREVLTTDRYRVRSILVQLDDSGNIGKADIVLNDKFLEAQIRTARKVNGIIGGGSADGGGNGIPADEEAALDTTTPNAPTGLVLATDFYIDVNGVTKALASADWNAPTLNTDGSAVTDLNVYEVQWRYDDDPESARRTIMTTDSNTTISGLDPDRTLLLRVRAWDNASPVAHKSAWTVEEDVLLAKDTTPPPVPSLPQLTSKLGTITYSWNGLGAAADPMPADFFRLKVYMGDVAGFAADAAHQIGTLPTAGSGIVTGLPADAVRYFKYRTLDRNGNESAASGEANQAVVRIAGPDLEANSVTANEMAVGSVDAEAIQVDALNGKKIVGAWILTAEDGPHWEILGDESTGYGNLILGYTGAVGEEFPAEIRVDAGRGSMTLRSADFDLGTPAELALVNEIPMDKTELESRLTGMARSMDFLAERQIALYTDLSRIDVFSGLEFEASQQSPRDRIGIDLQAGQSFGEPMSVAIKSDGGRVVLESDDDSLDYNPYSALKLDGGQAQLESGWWYGKVTVDKNGIKFGDDRWDTVSYPSLQRQYTNFVANPSVETNTTGFAVWGSATAPTRDTAQFSTGVASIRVTTGTGAGDGISYRNDPSMIVYPNQEYAFSVDGRYSAAGTLSLYVRWLTSAGALVSDVLVATSAVAANTWTRFFGVLTPPAGIGTSGLAIMVLRRPNADIVGARSIWGDRWIMRDHDSNDADVTFPADQWFDGTTKPSGAYAPSDSTVVWNGAANNSTSTLTLAPMTKRNYLWNPSFERENSGTPTYWAIDGGNTMVVGGEYSQGQEPFQFNGALVTTDAVNGAVFHSALAPQEIIPGRRYVARMDAKIDASTLTDIPLQLGIRFVAADNATTIQYIWGPQVTLTQANSLNQFLTLMVDTVAPAGSFGARLYMRRVGTVAGQKFHVDAALLRDAKVGEVFDKYEYFDGTTKSFGIPPDADVRWAGVVNTSESILVLGAPPDGGPTIDFSSIPVKNVVLPEMGAVQGFGGGFTKTGSGLEQFAGAAEIAFVAPPSGRVKVTVSGFLRAPADNSSTTIQFEVRTGAVPKSGTLIYPSNPNKGFGNFNNQYVKGDHAELVTGLTPGAAYNAYVSMNSAAAGAICTNTSILVEPTF